MRYMVPATAASAAAITKVIETFWAEYVSNAYKDAAAFSILAIVMIFLPQGILGRPDVEKV